MATLQVNIHSFHLFALCVRIIHTPTAAAGLGVTSAAATAAAGATAATATTQIITAVAVTSGMYANALIKLERPGG